MLLPVLSTIKTFFPSGFLKATEESVDVMVDEIRTDPGRTNLEA